MFKKWWVYHVGNEWKVDSFFTIFKIGFFLPKNAARCGPFSDKRLAKKFAENLTAHMNKESDEL